MRRLWLKICISILFLFATCFAERASDEVRIDLGIEANGSPTAVWLAAIESRIPKEEFERIRLNKRPMSTQESAWLDLVREVAPLWVKRRKDLLIPFRGIERPKRVAILVGNQIGDDGFTFGEDTVCLDLAALVENYGDPRTIENRGRLIRFLDHEFTHLLHHAWLRKYPIPLSTPLDRALRDLLVEGIGNYRSLSAKWVNPNGTLTETAKAALSGLQPVFVQRLTKLKTARDAEEDTLVAGLSRGPFNKKWGALTVALWLASETKGDARRLHIWVKAGPTGILRLAAKHLPLHLLVDFEKAFPSRRRC